MRKFKSFSFSKKNEIPMKLLFDKYNNNILGINQETIDFSPNSLEKHKSEFDNIEIEKYRKNTKTLSNSSINDNILEFSNDNVYVFRYDKEHNEFTAIKPSDVIETYFKPKTGYDFGRSKQKNMETKKICKKKILIMLVGQ